ncbi:hypothetical protein [Glutamicibacter sp. NPDC087673]|uniref:hypothetical protein n=1 Tax=Glutamicibacter sp. NPDC087673 TaxID=3363997 RepID=UPI003809D313
MEDEDQDVGDDEKKADDEIFASGELSALVLELVLCKVVTNVISFGQEGLLIDREVL